MAETVASTGKVDENKFEQGILNEDFDVIKEQIEAGINVNKKLSTGFLPINEIITPALGLLVEITSPNIMIVKLLLQGGADLNKQSGLEGSTPLTQASFYGYLNIVKLLVDCGADINSSDKSNASALMYSTMCKNDNKYEIAEYLLKKGADVNRKESTIGLNALGGAMRFNDTKMIQLLKKYGAK
ncbi:MAG: hypothetical protein HOB68_04135 [Candidatus Marinimicrobia bacterium]|jgi:hypothetical protein|nr:hypothetical protein [Candidatus Neomarinimicrobiota bacterium]MBT4685034.1 hypothetical protein [Candidatus Neomarinimicrobiota bacterium]